MELVSIDFGLGLTQAATKQHNPLNRKKYTLLSPVTVSAFGVKMSMAHFQHAQTTYSPSSLEC
jgi:hypothetical protein